ncbi:MAG: hypothetical protein ACOYY3_19475 [Chloroflexota bacterium]
MMNDSKGTVRPWAVTLKGGILFLIVNFLFSLPWAQGLGSLSLYNHVVPGLNRFSGTTNLNAFINSHIISQPKKPDEFRVLMIGDSSVWGVLLDYEETTTGKLSDTGLQTCTGDQVLAYDLGIGFKSLVKDLIVLDLALEYQPDMVVWFVTLETFTDNRQLNPPFVAQNPEQVRYLKQKYDLDLALGKKFTPKTFWDKTLIGQRSHLADLVSFELSALAWGATGEDGKGRASDPPPNDLSNDKSFNGWKPPAFDETKLRFDLFDAGIKAAGDVPVIVVNEPIFIANGKNSDVRYNENYPKWAFDQYREMMLRHSQEGGWDYLDLWDAVPSESFSNSSFHRDETGEEIVFQYLAPLILDLACR